MHIPGWAQETDILEVGEEIRSLGGDTAEGAQESRNPGGEDNLGCSLAGFHRGNSLD